MAEIKDLEQCNYFPFDCSDTLAIGWLSKDSQFNTGAVDSDFFEKLKELAERPWAPITCTGVHHCELCQFKAPAFCKNLFIPWKGKIFIAPAGIVHYIAQHWYKPPQAFIDAVMECPEMNSMLYKKSFLENGGRRILKSLNVQ